MRVMGVGKQQTSEKDFEYFRGLAGGVSGMGREGCGEGRDC